MRKLLTFVALIFSSLLHAQVIDIVIIEDDPYYDDMELNIEIYLKNNTNDTISYFDSRGPSWESFKEKWDLNVNSRAIEMPPLNNAFDNKYPDSTIITLYPGEENLIRTRTIPLDIVGQYSLTYTQEQSPVFVNKFWADSTVTDSLIHLIAPFKVYANTQFQVYHRYDTTINERNAMSWEEWKDYRTVKLYSRDKHFDNLFAAFRYPEEVYALTLYCDKMEAEDIRRIGRLKNLKALTLRNYEVDFYPKELAALNLYELTLIPKNETNISLHEGLSNNNTLRELTARFYDSLPKPVLQLKHLIYLDISDSDIKTIHNLKPLKNLEVLIANNNTLADINALGLGELPKLRELNLSGNKAINSLDPILKCENLEFLVINRTNIPAIPDEIEQLSKLKKLSISNDLTAVSDSLGNLTDMRYLSFSGNTQLDSLPKTILKMKKLLHLDISRTNITVLPEGLSDLPLEYFNIMHSPVESSKDYRILKRNLDKGFKE